MTVGVYSVSSYSTYVASDSSGGIFGTNSTAADSSADSTLPIVLGVLIGLIIISIGVVSFIAYKRYKARSLVTVHPGIDNSVDYNKEPVKLDAAASGNPEVLSHEGNNLFPSSPFK